MTYTLRAIANPISVTAIGAVICWMLGRHDYFGAGFVTVMMLVLIADVASCPYVRVRLDRASARRARDQRVEYIKLHNLVDDIDDALQSPRVAARRA